MVLHPRSGRLQDRPDPCPEPDGSRAPAARGVRVAGLQGCSGGDAVARTIFFCQWWSLTAELLRLSAFQGEGDVL